MFKNGDIVCLVPSIFEPESWGKERRKTWRWKIIRQLDEEWLPGIPLYRSQRIDIPSQPYESIPENMVVLYDTTT